MSGGRAERAEHAEHTEHTEHTEPGRTAGRLHAMGERS
ncbi:hypothetical protein FHS42_003228 [Streptomyces zagrosensis]|uniref:Uncharacterized protein n=1 Tax=Streptomyces zagrosensis TaxID=1042984 RepID=A0A7W9UYP2_9ACTN|nr:hypothetical protein [Streptomyces zagrosensis]